MTFQNPFQMSLHVSKCLTIILVLENDKSYLVSMFLALRGAALTLHPS